MGRRHYETDADLAREAAAVATLCEALGCEALKMPLASRADALLYRNGEAKTVIEFKRRSTRRRAYPTYMIGKAKYDALCAWVPLGFKAALLVQWSDELAYVMVPIEHDTGEGGRTDRGDERDIEEVVHIATEHFKTIRRGTPAI